MYIVDNFGAAITVALATITVLALVWYANTGGRPRR